MKRMESKVAVVYGDGNVGSAIAKAFAREGARVFLTGRTPSKLKTIADSILAGGGSVELAELVWLGEAAGAGRMRVVVSKTGKIDVSFNAIGIPQKGIQGIALTELSSESFLLPILTYAKSYF